MDRFPERMSNRYDRYNRDSRYDGDRYDDRYESDRRRRYAYDLSDNIEAIVEKSNHIQMEEIADCFDDTKGYINKSEETIISAIENNTSKIDELEKSLTMLKSISVETAEDNKEEEFFDAPSVDPSAMKEILRAIDDNKSLLTLIRQDLINISQHQVEAIKSMDESEEKEVIPANYLTTEQADMLFKKLEEHVHSENVKCYRNVQAALSDHDSEGIQTFLKALTGVKVVSIISLLTSLSTLALLVIYVFGLIKF